MRRSARCRLTKGFNSTRTMNSPITAINLHCSATFSRFLAIMITGIMAVGAIFGAVNTMYAAVASRTPEIAVLLTLGFHPRSILASFLAESAVIALLGGVIGCLLALPINGVVTSTTNWASFSRDCIRIPGNSHAAVIGNDLRARDGCAGRIFSRQARVADADRSGAAVRPVATAGESCPRNIVECGVERCGRSGLAMVQPPLEHLQVGTGQIFARQDRLAWPAIVQRPAQCAVRSCER